jgi:hypothetical protein
VSDGSRLFCPTGRCQPSFKTMQSFFFFHRNA